ncbi:ABC transporter ATP-binding protein [Caminibacter mediatlanticus TB-2]|uniref:ABC transporter ATP-binding protein n=2 Tax=Caminibacter mediatlanticus TB-2 TaxID=391592 RepID=A0ABX5VAL5_9BACT|nr:ABC transporter ATP-binding protein [Caminibacter mediatlanticus TB-2]
MDDEEFISLLGPSGYEKTTIFRIIAGFENVRDGELYIDNKLYSSKTTNILPQDRNIAMLFQSYTLWPHMSI